MAQARLQQNELEEEDKFSSPVKSKVTALSDASDESDIETDNVDHDYSSEFVSAITIENY